MRDSADRLDAVVHAQQGYFTAKQAIAAGYAKRTHGYHVRTGAWVREHRGLYRLARYPASAEGQYVLWSLWSCNRRGEAQGVYSHQTALSVHDLSDVMPTRLHMTVPSAFRRMAAPPSILSLHFRNLPPGDIEQRQGYRVVCALRAVADLLDDGTEAPHFLRQALSQALKRGLVTRAQSKAHPRARTLAAILKGDAA